MGLNTNHPGRKRRKPAIAWWIAASVLLLGATGCRAPAPVATTDGQATDLDPARSHGIVVALQPPVPTGAREERAPPAEATRPWIAPESIWFFSHSADLAASETTKLATLAQDLARHPDATVGIHCASAVEPAGETLNRRRVSAIRLALHQAGIAASQIHVCPFRDQPSSLNRQIVVLVSSSL